VKIDLKGQLLTRVYNVILKHVKMLIREGLVPLFFKDKDDIQCYNNYRGIKLLSYSM